MAFADDNVVNFEEKKMKEVEEQGPKTIDAAVPGWGQWGGHGLTTKPRMKNIPGIAPRERKDNHLKHVIISEDYTKKYKTPKIPHPYTSKEEYEKVMRVPVGKEWTTSRNLKRITEPRVKVSRGYKIEPIKYIKQKESEKRHQIDSLLIR